MPGPEASTRDFPSEFLWGTATAAHQVEGENFGSDWWEFEQEPGRIENGDTSRRACDHYRRYREDFRMLRGLGQNAHRLSIEWARVEPEPGRFDAEAIAHYRDVLQVLRDLGMTPMVTLHHFSSPAWFARRGGFTKGGSARLFEAFVRRLVDELGEMVGLWCTINEPNIYAVQGWLLGEFPPGRRNDVAGLVSVLGNLRRAHELAYAAIKERRPEAQVGIAQHRWFLLPARARSRLDRLAVAIGDLPMTSWPAGLLRWRRVVEASSDFVGLNHYTGTLCRFDLTRPGEQFMHRFNPPEASVTQMGWVVVPEWFGASLRELKALGKPVYVTENGIATLDDEVRQRFLLDYLGQLADVMREGLDVRGYFHWTAIDNFEWAHGFTPRFGLVAMDSETGERTPRPSAHLMGRIAESGRLSAGRSPGS